MAMRAPAGAIARTFSAHSAMSSTRLWTKKTWPPRPSSLRSASPRISGSKRQTKVRIARRSAGGVAMIEISRRPPIAICSVRGIGVAVSVSTSTWVRSSLRRSLCATPKRCSSSMTTRPRSLKRTSFDSMRCVPTTTSSLPCGQPRPRSSAARPCCESATAPPTRTGKSSKRSENVTKCCSASTVVGARIATCLPPSTASSVARSATSVLP